MAARQFGEVPQHERRPARRPDPGRSNGGLGRILQQGLGNAGVSRLFGQADSLGGSAIPAKIKAALGQRAGGAGLPAPVVARLNASLGADVSGVRVHTDARSAELARQVQAEAFSYGDQLYFAAGAYQRYHGRSAAAGSRGGACGG